jgi:hypothetical protein
MQKIFVYISSLVFCLTVFSAQAQESNKPQEPNKAQQPQQPNKGEEADTIPLFNGMTVQADVASVIGSVTSSGVTYSYEVGAQLDFKHKFYPIIEIGHAGADKTSTNDISYQTNGLFGRVGVDVNLIRPKKDSRPTNNLFLVGVRMGMSKFKYNLNNVTVTDSYWGGSETLDYPNVSTAKIWYEIVLGIRVEVIKNLYMGWSVRTKNMISQDATGDITPWYVPGFGLNKGSVQGLNYTIGYKFNIRSKIPQMKAKPKGQIKNK